MQSKATDLDRFFDELHLLQQHLLSVRAAANTPEDHAADESITIALESLQVAEAELRQQQASLMEAQIIAEQERRRYFHLFEYAPDAYLVTTAAGIITEANQAAATLFNIPQKYLTGKPISLYVTAAERRDFRNFVYNLTSFGSTQLQARELMIQSRHMELPIPVSATVVPIYEGDTLSLRWILRDITRRRTAELRLEATNQTLTALIEAIPLAIIVVNRAGNVTLWNHGAEVITGWTADEAIGLRLPYIPEDLWPDFEERFTRLLAGIALPPVETERQRKDGSRFPVRLSAAPLFDSDGTVIGSIGMISDISDEKANRAQLRQVKGQLREVRVAEQRRLARDLHDSAVQQLVGLQFQLAHHRRQARQAAVASPVLDPISSGLEEVEAEIKGIIQLLRGVISDLRPPGLEEYGLCRALEGYVAKLNRDRTDHTPETEIMCPPDNPPITLALATMLFRVVQEGMTNMQRHAHARHAHIVMTHNHNHLNLIIEDDGQGFTVPTPLTTLTYDQHFGLVGIAEDIEMAGGTLTIRSDIGQGTTLTIKVPIQEK